MNEQLKKFIEWLPTKVKELEDKTPEQIAETINVLGQSKEGLKQLKGLFQEFKNEAKTTLFKNGGKLEYILYLKNGGCPSCNKPKITKAQDGLKYEQSNDISKGPKIRNSKAKKIAKSKGQSGQDYRTAKNNAKSALRENTDLRGRDRRQAARRMAAGLSGLNRYLIDDIPIENQLTISEITGPKRYDEAVITTGNLSEIPEKRIIKEVTKPQSSNIPSIREELAAKKAKTDAWYQYQYERNLYDRNNGVYRPNQDSAAYMHWMWEDFNNSWDPNTNTVKRDYQMRSPTQDQLLKYLNAGKFTHGVLSTSNPEEYGVNVDNRMFYERGGYPDYRADAKAAGIPTTSRLYDGTANVLATLISTVGGAGVENAMRSAPEVWGLGNMSDDVVRTAPRATGQKRWNAAAQTIDEVTGAPKGSQKFVSKAEFEAVPTDGWRGAVGQYAKKPSGYVYEDSSSLPVEGFGNGWTYWFKRGGKIDTFKSAIELFWESLEKHN